MAGTLFIVATPLGNLEDMTFRAVRVLREADLIAAEDTRHSRKLLSHYAIDTPTTPCHEHNETRQAQKLISLMKQGQDIALVTDAGTPCISDPGYRLVKAAAEQGIPVTPIPGCSAAIAGLSASGLPSDRFLFVGFPPKKQQQQQKALQALADEPATLIFYESPRRITKLIQALQTALGDRPACLARELTKQYEEFIRGTFSQILNQLEQKETIKGECSLFVQGADQTALPSLDRGALESLILDRLENDPAPTSKLAKEIAAAHNLPKKQVYDTILKLKK